MQQRPFVLPTETSLQPVPDHGDDMRCLFVGHTQPVVSGIVTREDLGKEALAKSKLSTKANNNFVIHSYQQRKD